LARIFLVVETIIIFFSSRFCQDKSSTNAEIDEKFQKPRKKTWPLNLFRLCQGAAPFPMPPNKFTRHRQASAKRFRGRQSSPWRKKQNLAGVVVAKVVDHNEKNFYIVKFANNLKNMDTPINSVFNIHGIGSLLEVFDALQEIPEVIFIGMESLWFVCLAVPPLKSTGTKGLKCEGPRRDTVDSFSP